MKYQPYEKYKDSGIEWLGEIPEGWDLWKASHGFSKIGSGTTPKSDNLDYYDGEIPWVTTSELRETLITDTEKKVTYEALKDYPTLKRYKNGSLLIAMYGATIGRLGILGIDATVNQACCVFEKPKVFDTKYIFYWFQMVKPILIADSSGGGQPNLNQDYLKSLKFAKPSMEQQKAISAFLDDKTAEIDALIGKKEELLLKLAEKRTAMITRAVTKGLNLSAPMKDSGIDWLGQIPAHWEVKRLRFGITSNPLKSKIVASPDTLVSFVPMDAVGEYGGLRLEVEKQLDEVGGGYTYFGENDVVVAKITPCFENGKGALAQGLTNGIAFGTTELHVLRARDHIDPEFLFYLTITDPFRKIGESEMYGAGGQKRINEGFIKNFKIGIPPLDDQKEIVKHIKKILTHNDAVKSSTEKAILTLKEYRSALITNAVTGKIKVAYA